MSMENFSQLMLEAAEATDRKLGPARVKQLKTAYAHFKKMGLDDTRIKALMALTEHEMRLIRRPA